MHIDESSGPAPASPTSPRKACRGKVTVDFAKGVGGGHFPALAGKEDADKIPAAT